MLTSSSGLLKVSPYAVPQAGFLLFASSSARGMPGGIMLRRITFYNTMLGSQQVEEQYLNSRYQREKKPPPQQLALSDGPAGGKPLWSPDQQTVLHDIVELFQRLERLLIPLGIKTLDVGSQPGPKEAVTCCDLMRVLFDATFMRYIATPRMLMLILEKRDGQTYRLTVINSGIPGLDWHACSSAQNSDLTGQPILEALNIAQWTHRGLLRALIWFNVSGPLALHFDASKAMLEPLPLYDKFIPWLIGCPLEHYFVTNVYGFDGQVPEQEQCQAGQASVSIDLSSARALSTSERTVLRIAAKQFALGAVKAQPDPALLPMTRLLL
eukprot:s2515_g5.t1